MEGAVDTVMPENFYIPTDPSGNFIIEDNKVLLISKITGKMIFIPMTDENKELLGKFGIEFFQDAVPEKQGTECTDILLETSCIPSKQQKKEAHKWTREETLHLINLLKINENNFVSTTIKNDVIYKNIAEQLGRYTNVQVKDRVKYLKLRFMKRKDNLKKSGAEAIHFEYFEELDALWGHKPNVTPKSVASSSLGFTSSKDVVAGPLEQPATEDSGTETESSAEPQHSQKKRRKFESRDGAMERRHRENLQMQERAINSFEKFIDKIIE